jgi:thiamine pyrophosphokinase
MPEKKAVLLGGGEILDYAKIAARIHPGDYIVAADSGYDHCEKLGVTPDLLVGDFDSMRGSPPLAIPRLPFPAEKDYTDTTLAIETILAKGYKNILLAGMLGGRLDHTLANLGSLAHLSTLGVDALMTDGVTDAYAVTSGKLVLPPREHCYFSLLAFSGQCRGVTIHGAKYPLNDYPLRYDEPRAISNEFMGESVTITVREGTIVVLVVPKETHLS